MEYKNDKCEFTAFVKAGLDSKEQENIEICIERVTKTVKEDFLNARARLYKDEVKNDAEVMTAFRRLSVICNENVQQCYECPVSKYCNTYIENARKNVNDDSLKMIDLFCGAGGLSLGFTQEGFVTTLANDIQDCCVDTYAHNHPETPRDHIILGNIKDVVNELDELLDGRSADIVIGGPPCQGFSINAKNFGVPQNRERLIYIGNCLGIDNEKIFNEIFELSEKIPEYNLGDALFGLRKLEASRVKNSTESGSIESGYKIEKNYCTETNDYISYINQGRVIDVVSNHKARYNNDRDIEIFGRMEPGDRSDDPKIADIMPYARRNGIFKDKYFKLENDKVCKTITAHMKFDCNMYIHPTQARGLTPREAARVQSYPDDYFFRGAYTKTYMQIGNSVPPLLGRAIAQVIKGYMKGGNA